MAEKTDSQCPSPLVALFSNPERWTGAKTEQLPKKRSRADAGRENGKKYGGRKRPWSDDCHWVIELHLVAWEIVGGSKAEFFRRLVWDLDSQCESKGEKPLFEPKNRRKAARSIAAKHDRWQAKKKRAAI